MGIRTTTVYECDYCERVEHNPDKFVGWNWFTWEQLDGTIGGTFYCPECYQIVKAMSRKVRKT